MNAERTSPKNWAIGSDLWAVSFWFAGAGVGSDPTEYSLVSRLNAGTEDAKSVSRELRNTVDENQRNFD